MKNKVIATVVLASLWLAGGAAARGQTQASKDGQTVSEQDIQLLRLN
jgi:hypothetical protein